MSICSMCANSNICLNAMGMDGNTTWFSPLWTSVDWSSETLDSMRAPQSEDECNGFERVCNCGSGKYVMTCGEASQYCG